MRNKIYIHDSEFWSTDEYLDGERGEEYLSKDFILDLLCRAKNKLETNLNQFIIEPSEQMKDRDRAQIRLLNNLIKTFDEI